MNYANYNISVKSLSDCISDTVIEHRGLWRQCAIVQVPPKYGGGSYQVICKDRISSANVDKVFEMSGSGGEAYSGPQLEMIDTRG
jgi:hypothetical protein